jgi:genome maintenance exonuclease 1
MQKQFKSSLYPRTHKLTSVDTDSGRIYTLQRRGLPDQQFLSVTSQLKFHDDIFYPGNKLEKWKQRVGEKEANKISIQARRRGSAVHSLAEKYLLNDVDYKKGSMPFNLDEFNKIKIHLDNHISVVCGVEFPLYSNILNTAGRADLIAVWDGKLSVIDLKTSKKIKKESDILSYFVQASTYAAMFTEHYDKVEQIVVIVQVDHDDPQIFVKNVIDYESLILKVFLGVSSESKN